MVKLLSEFKSPVTALWATTYTFEPDNFDEFLLRKLGDPPLNINLLVDGERIQRVWDTWVEEPWRFRRINREYLVRGIPWPGHAFHPKTYLFATKTGAVLCVGSGNLTLQGIQRGNEVFCRFSTETDFGRRAIGTWRGWMEQLVLRVDDPLLTQRWMSFVNGASWLTAPSGPSAFLHNLNASMLDQLVAAVTAPVDELHILAPFFDADCAALSAVIERLAPATLHLYLPRDVSVNGQRLHGLLGHVPCAVYLHRFDHHEFVHAKLIGVVSGQTGHLLSGSPNCSRPAMLTSGEHGNCEVGIMARADADTIRAAFLPPTWAIVDIARDDLTTLQFRSQSESVSSYTVRLTRAQRTTDGRIEAAFEESPGVVITQLGMSGRVMPLVKGRTVEAVPADHTVGAVWLCDAGGERRSNTMPVDDPPALFAMLAQRVVDADKPRELNQADLSTQVGDLIRRLNQECIFDIDEVPAAAGGLRVAGADAQSEDEASAFWERFEQQQLRQDYRASKYALFGDWAGGTSGQIYDELLAELRSMLDRTPDTDLKLAPIGGEGKPSASGPANPQIQIRVGNVLSRWSRALADRRLRALDPLSPVRNYISLLGAIAECWERRYIGHERLSAIALTLLQSFIGSARRKGYLLTLEPEQLGRANALLEAVGAPELAAAIVFVSLDPVSSWKSQVYAWQPTIVAALETGQLHAGERAVIRLKRLRDPGLRLVESNDVDNHLERLATHTDDTHWAHTIAEEFGLAKVELRRSSDGMARRFPYVMRVNGVHDLFSDSRMVPIVRQAIGYKKIPGLIVESASNGVKRPQRLSVRLTGAIHGLDDRTEINFGADITVEDLIVLEEFGLGFSGLIRENAQKLERDTA